MPETLKKGKMYCIAVGRCRPSLMVRGRDKSGEENFMSEDKKTEKKIAKRREDILFWLKAAEKYANQYKQAVDEKKEGKE